MKIFKSTGLMLVMFLLIGVNVEASSPRVIITDSGEVQVTNVGDNVAGIEINLELSGGNYSENVFTPITNSNYTFEKVSGNKITIYSTGREDLARDGTVILGNIQTTSSATFMPSTTVKLVDQSLAQTIYANVVVIAQIDTGNTGDTGNTNNTGSSSSTQPEAVENNSTETEEEEDADAEDLSHEQDESVEDDAEELEGEFYLEDDYQTDDYTSSDIVIAHGEKEQYSFYIWLIVLMLITVIIGVAVYLKRLKVMSIKMGKHEEINAEITKEKIVTLNNTTPEKYEGTDMSEYQK